MKILLGFVLLCAIIVYMYYSLKLKHIKKMKPIYIYETYSRVPNPVLVITDLSYQDSLIAHYEFLEKNGVRRPFNFPLKALMTRTPCYFIEYTDDSLLIKFGCFYENSENAETYDEGYAYYKTVHDSPPPPIGLFK